MDLSQQLRAYLSSHPDSITSSLTIKGVLKDYNCPERLRENLARLIDCGLGPVLRERPGQLGAGFVRDIIQEMDRRFGTAEAYTLEGIRIWAEVYGIQVVYPEPLSGPPEVETQTHVPGPEVIRPQTENKETSQKPSRKRGGFVSLKTMNRKVQLLFFCGFFLILYHIFTFRYFLPFGLEFMSVDAIILLCLGQLHILKTGLPVYVKGQNGKYKEDWKETVLGLLSLVYTFITLNQMVHLEDNSAVPLGSSQFYIAASFLMLLGYFGIMMLFRVPKKEKQRA